MMANGRRVNAPARALRQGSLDGPGDVSERAIRFNRSDYRRASGAGSEARASPIRQKTIAVSHAV